MSADIVDRLRHGPATAAELQREFDISQPTLSRRVAALRGQVVAFGRARATRYALQRHIRELAAELPVYRISSAGEAREIGVLIAVHGGFAYRDLESGGSSFHDSLPWFLADMRPQGFLGRLFPRLHPELGLPERVADWNEDQVLYAVARRGDDMVGNLVIGEESFTRWSANPTPVALAEGERAGRYPALAEQALAGEVAGSSAGGEQPKFLLAVAARPAVQHVLVKFSEPLDSAAGRRSGDLLLCEHHALQTITAAGLPAAQTQVLDAGGRRFLEVARFDRVGERGRKGLISLAALDDQFVGDRRDWLTTALALERLGWIEPDDVQRVGWLQAFGGFIANADMHFGNLSFLYEGRRPIVLAPVYDMLPMLYWPRRGELPLVEFTPPPPPARAVSQARQARRVAVEFWQRVASDDRISSDMRQTAQRNERVLDQLKW